MIISVTRVVAALAMLATPTLAPAQQASARADTVGATAAQRAWWHAFVLADTAYLRAHSSPALSVTLSSGRTFGRDAALAESASHTTGAELGVQWSDEVVRSPAPNVAVVTSRVTETAGATSSTYRYLTLLERAASAWRVVAAQSTREAEFTPRAYKAVAGQLADFAGAYRTPRGLSLRVVVRDSALALIEPSGKEVRMEPIAAGLFEFTELSPSNGVVRLLFTRDATGHVTTLSQLTSSGVNTFPRQP